MISNPMTITLPNSEKVSTILDSGSFSSTALLFVTLMKIELLDKNIQSAEVITNMWMFGAQCRK
jgi:hypothetical protein